MHLVKFTVFYPLYSSISVQHLSRHLIIQVTIKCLKAFCIQSCSKPLSCLWCTFIAFLVADRILQILKFEAPGRKKRKNKKKKPDFFKHSFKPTQWILNACGMLDKWSNFLKQSHSLYLVYECLNYLNEESRNSIFLYIFPAHEQNVLQIKKLYIKEKNDSSEIPVLFSFPCLIISIINCGVVNAFLTRAEDVR